MKALFMKKSDGRDGPLVLFALSVALTVGLLLGGCASAPPELHEYLLRPESLEVVSENRPAVVLKSVAVAPYLDQQGIVLQTSSVEIRVARHHLWAEPLAGAIGRYLQVALGNRTDRRVEMTSLTTGSNSSAVAVLINRFHGDAGGEVRLVAQWRLESEQAEPMLFTFDEQARQTADGYDSLVAAHATLLDRLAGAMADSLLQAEAP